MYSGIYFAEFGNENRKGKQNVSDRDRVRIMRWKNGDPKFYHLAKLGWNDLAEWKKIELVIRCNAAGSCTMNIVHSTHSAYKLSNFSMRSLKWACNYTKCATEILWRSTKKKHTENTSKLEWSNLKKHFTVNATLLFYIVDWDPM